MMRLTKRVWFVLWFAVLAALLACNVSGVAGPDAVQATVNAALTQIPPTEAPATAAPVTDTPVPGTATLTETPTVTLTATMTSTPVTPSPTSIPCNAAAFVKDVTYPDNAAVIAGANFTKTWRLQNVGSCSWTSGYRLIFDHGDRMSAPDSVQVTSGEIPPGAKVDVSVDLKAPGDPGTYQGYFRLRSSDGVVFGIGPGADGAFWVKIKANLLELHIDPFIIVTLSP
jgi:hypothetical protein